MSKSITAGMYGKVVNKAGGLVWALWNGLNTQRAHNAHVSNPRTTLQLQVRAHFSVLAQLAKAFRPALLMAMHSTAKAATNTIYGWFIKVNYPIVSISAGGLVTVDYSSLKVTKGGCRSVNTSGSIDWGTTEHLTIQVPISNDGLTDENKDDEVFLVVFDPETKASVLSLAATRSDDKVSVVCPASFNGVNCHLYMFAISHEEQTMNMPSDSVYLGLGEVQ